MMKDGMELAEFCVDYSEGLGCDYAEARYVEGFSRGLVYRNSQPVSGGVTPSSGIGVRILVGGSMGFASIDRMDRGLAEEAITKAYRIAKNATRKTPIDLGEPVENRAKWKMKVKQSLEDVGIEDIMETCAELNKCMEGLASYLLMVTPRIERKYFISSEGTSIASEVSRIMIVAILTAAAKVGSEQRYLDFTLAGGWERIREENLFTKLADEVARLRNAAENAVMVKELLDQPVDMIVGQEVAGIIAHENVGHPSEGDRIMGREGAQAGESFWRDLKLGESRVGSDVVNVSEDPTIPNTSGYYEYDDEGVKSRKRELVKNGIINEPLLNREFGARFGLGSNAAARAVSYNREPIIRMANTYFEPGDHSFDELVEDVKLGVFMRSFQEWNIDDRRYQSKYTGSEAYLIRNGEVTDTLVRRPVMETTSVGMLSSIDAVSRNLSFEFPGTCGKSDPMQGVPVYAGGGEIRFRGIRLGGVG